MHGSTPNPFRFQRLLTVTRSEASTFIQQLVLQVQGVMTKLPRPDPSGHAHQKGHAPGLTSGPFRLWVKNTAKSSYCACTCSVARLRTCGSLQTGHNGPRAASWTGSGGEVSRGAPGLAERRQFLPLLPPSATAEAFQSRHVRQRRLRTGSKGQGTEGLSTLRVARQPTGPRPAGTHPVARQLADQPS